MVVARLAVVALLTICQAWVVSDGRPVRRSTIYGPLHSIIVKLIAVIGHKKDHHTSYKLNVFNFLPAGSLKVGSFIEFI